MREILFRGQYLNGSNWGIGNLVYSEQGNPYIIPKEIVKQDGHHLKIYEDEPFWVDKETVGQYIGVIDDNGVKVFDGDIVKMSYGGDKWVSRVSWFGGGFCVKVADFFGHDYDYMYVEDMMGLDIEHIKVIGNIYDNKNLLK